MSKNAHNLKKHKNTGMLVWLFFEHIKKCHRRVYKLQKYTGCPKIMYTKISYNDSKSVYIILGHPVLIFYVFATAFCFPSEMARESSRNLVWQKMSHHLPNEARHLSFEIQENLFSSKGIYALHLGTITIAATIARKYCLLYSLCFYQMVNNNLIYVLCNNTFF